MNATLTPASIKTHPSRTCANCTPHDRMRAGLCPDCAPGVLRHGPWSNAQMAEAAADIGMPVADFRDCCDACMVALLGGDVAYVQSLIHPEGRP
ncbi:MAG: hypothetical protein QM586_04940 [Xenophilus sp.]